MFFRAASFALVTLSLGALTARATIQGIIPPAPIQQHLVIPPRVIISVKDQKLMVVENGQRAAVYPVSTSKFGIGDRWGSMETPLGWLQVAEKIGDHAPPGAVFHKRHFTGEILPPNAPGRDPIVTRIIWLRGLEPGNSHAFERCIYIHGTPEEKNIGRPASYGCVRMCSKDVTQVYAEIQLGALVRIIPDSLPALPKYVPGRNPPEQMIAAPAPVPAGSAIAKGNQKSDRKAKRISASAAHRLASNA